MQHLPAGPYLAQLKHHRIRGSSTSIELERLPRSLVAASALEVLDVASCLGLELGRQDAATLRALPRLRRLVVSVRGKRALQWLQGELPGVEVVERFGP